ncbi:helix-turn-helix domain-containing protein [Nocardiopsis algeriensis]|uniref:DNA-binding XRE family transcriptional regulator n=1 Tax=Nocardiopsis algeriensis TaxID=1478215 RepID=A0A841J1L8_9ACTN|nr:helix-turn-helix transcriptional regulator [Nocardiopsis algeriensis]MBB6122221.1 DNA-binding XRE family transcriptional regulator [Nocardiopsis algeriensis]
MARGKGLPLDPGRLRAARTAAGLSQRQVAEMLGTTRQQLIRYESGAERPEVTRLAALAAAVGVGVGDLVDPGSLPAGLAGLRVQAGLTLAAAADAVRAQLPAGAGIACSRPVLAAAERGVLPPSWAPPPAAGMVQGALGVAYGAGGEQVAAAWSETFGAAAATDQEAEGAGSVNGTPAEGVSETTPPAEVPVPPRSAELPVCPYSPSELHAAHVKDHGNGVYQVRVDHTPQGWVRRDGPGRWSYAAHDPDTGRPRTWTPVLASSPTRARAVEALLSAPGPLWSAPMPGLEEGAPRPVTPPSGAVELPFGNDGQELTTPPQRPGPAPARVEVVVRRFSAVVNGHVQVRYHVHVDGAWIGTIHHRADWDLQTGWVFQAHLSSAEQAQLTPAEQAAPDALSTQPDLADAVPELLAAHYGHQLEITSLWGERTDLPLRPRDMEQWELRRGRVSGREDIYVRSRCWGWLQPATGGGFTAHTVDGPVPHSLSPTREEAALALWTHLYAPLPPPNLGERAHTKRRLRPRAKKDRPLCPYTPAELARVHLVEDPASEKGARLYQATAHDGTVLGFVWRSGKTWRSCAPQRGRMPQPPPVVPAAPTRAAALERLLAQPGPLWADPADTIVH